MLGLDAKTLSVPDYEITARLERLLTIVQQPTMVVPMGTPVTRPSHPTNRPSTQVHPPIPQHHHHHYRQPATHSSQGRHRSPSPNSRRSEASQRARSLSPLHVGIDPRTY